MDVGLSVYDIAADELVDLAIAAEDAGFTTLWLGEHVVLPIDYGAEHPTDGSDRNTSHRARIIDADTTLIDPLVALAGAAMATKHIRLATGIYILPLRHPLVTARMAVTLQALAGGRFMLGVGSGWLTEEFAALGIPFDQRRGRFEESIAILRTAWSGGEFRYSGRHFGFDRVVVSPEPVNVPLVLGGNTEPALRRAAAVADGWFSSGNPTLDEAERLRARLTELCVEAGRASSLPLYVRMAGSDPDDLARYAERGFDHVTVWANQLWPATGDVTAKRDRFREAADQLRRHL